jgi:3-deoxy-D-manno-octulosonic-acid transferase
MYLFSKVSYFIFIQLYNAAIAIVALFNHKAKLLLEGRKKTAVLAKEFNLKHTTGKRIWFHCASLGEFEQARPLLERIKKEKPESLIILTFFSPSGYEIRKEYSFADLVCYLPADTPENAMNFISEIKPDLVIWVKYEFWFYHLQEIKTKKIPLILISANFRKEQIFFSYLGPFFREMLSFFTQIFVQNSTSKELLSSININSEIATDTRFDRVFEISKKPQQWESLNKLKKSNTEKIVVAGSTWIEDENHLLALINDDSFKGYKFIIAPHQIDTERLQKLFNSIKTSKIYFSKLNETSAVDYKVIIVDGMGFLSSLYQYADVAYIGGGFGKSIHNVLEAAVFGVPVIMGPNHKKAIEAKELISKNAAICVQDSETLKEAFNFYLKDVEREKAGKLAATYVESNLGSTQKIYEYLQSKNYL